MTNPGANREKNHKVDARQIETVVKLRRQQIRSVAIGSGGGLLFLIGLSWQWYPIAWIGLLVFTFALLSIIFFGVVAWWRFG